MFDQIIRSPIGQALIQVEAECLAQLGALCAPFGTAPSAEQIAERIERELRLGPGAYALDAAERRMQRAG